MKLKLIILKYNINNIKYFPIYTVSSSKNHLICLGPVYFLAENSASPCGFFFSLALDNIDNILRQTEDTLKAGDHSLYKIERQINPFEYICSCVGICPTKITSGLSIGYKN